MTSFSSPSQNALLRLQASADEADDETTHADEEDAGEPGVPEAAGQGEELLRPQEGRAELPAHALDSDVQAHPVRPEVLFAAQAVSDEIGHRESKS